MVKEKRFTVWDIAFWVLMALIIVMLAWRILGRSPGIEDLLVAIVGSEFLLWRYMYRHGRQISRLYVKVSKLDKKLARRLAGIERQLKRK